MPERAPIQTRGRKSRKISLEEVVTTLTIGGILATVAWNLPEGSSKSVDQTIISTVTTEKNYDFRNGLKALGYGMSADEIRRFQYEIGGRWGAAPTAKLDAATQWAIRQQLNLEFGTDKK